jgi:hypothetical protein
MNANASPAPVKESWSVTVLYQDTEVRQRAMQVCDHLMRQFWSEIEFDFSWWRFSFLEEEVLAERAASHLWDSDAIIIAVRSDGELPSAQAAWLEEAMARRGVRGGAFIALFCGEAHSAARTDAAMDAKLRDLAERGGMDYLTEPPNVLPGCLPDSLDNFSRRAEEHTTIMDNILKHAPPPRMFI